MPRVLRPEERYRCTKCRERIVYRAGARCLLCREPKHQVNQFFDRTDIEVRPKVRRIR